MWLTIIAVVFVLLFIRANWRPSGLPPGPLRLPIFGNLLNLAPDPLKAMKSLTKKYGPIVSLQLGTKDAIILADHDLILQAFRKKGNKFGDRPNDGRYFKIVTGEGSDIAMGHYGPRVIAQRKMIHAHLFSKVHIPNIEKHMLAEIAIMVDQFKAAAVEKKAINPTSATFRMAMTVIGRILFNRRFETKESDTLAAKFEYLMYSMGRPPLADLWPIFEILPDPRVAKLTKCKAELGAMFTEEINKHQATLDRNNPRDFTDELLIIKADEEGKNDYWNDNHMFHLIFDLFTGGMETSASTIEWFLAVIANHPEMQDKMYEEINKVVGTRTITLDDEKDLPFTCAVIKESMRFRHIGPNLLPHQCAEDAELETGGKTYKITKGTVTLPLWSALQHAPEMWGQDAHLFKPERFLDMDPIKEANLHLPFGTGNRQCIGMNMAKAEMFLSHASLMQNVRILPADGKPISMDGIAGLTYRPQPYKLNVTLRPTATAIAG